MGETVTPLMVPDFQKLEKPLVLLQEREVHVQMISNPTLTGCGKRIGKYEDIRLCSVQRAVLKQGNKIYNTN